MSEITVHEVQHKDVTIMCKTGSIATSLADLAVVSSTPQYAMDIEAAKAIATAGGRQFHDRRVDAINIAREHGDSYIVIDTKDIVAIPFQAVVAIPVRSINRTSMRVTYRQALKAAIDSELSSVVMPLLEWGLNIEIDRATQELSEAILTFSNFGNLTVISFIDINAQSIERLGQLLNNIPDMLRISVPSLNGVPPVPAAILNINRRLQAITFADTDVQYIGTYFHSLSEQDNNIKQEQPFKEIARNEIGKGIDLNSTQSFLCSICQNDLVTSAGNGEENRTSLKNDPVVLMTMCVHNFHKSCIETWFKTNKRCPLCMRWFAPSFGDQPMDSVMKVKRAPGSPPGHPNAEGWFKIRYVIPGGIQNANHLRCGVPFTGTTRTAYVPNDEGGRFVLKLLQKAFEHRHIFTIGDSVTSGVMNVPVWVIDHKTSQTGGPSAYGFPDPYYYERVTEQLAKVGITKEMLNK